MHTSTISHSSPPEESGTVLPTRPSTVTGSPVAHVDGYEHDKYSDQQRQHLPSPSVDTCRKRVGCVRRIWQGASKLGTQFKRQLPGYVSRGAWRAGGLNYLCRSRKTNHRSVDQLGLLHHNVIMIILLLIFTNHAIT